MWLADKLGAVVTPPQRLRVARKASSSTIWTDCLVEGPIHAARYLCQDITISGTNVAARPRDFCKALKGKHFSFDLRSCCESFELRRVRTDTL